jgi:hypothetical protein
MPIGQDQSLQRSEQNDERQHSGIDVKISEACPFPPDQECDQEVGADLVYCAAALVINGQNVNGDNDVGNSEQ